MSLKQMRSIKRTTYDSRLTRTKRTTSCHIAGKRKHYVMVRVGLGFQLTFYVIPGTTMLQLDGLNHTPQH